MGGVRGPLVPLGWIGVAEVRVFIPRIGDHFFETRASQHGWPKDN